MKLPSLTDQDSKKLGAINKSESLLFKNKTERFYKKPLVGMRSEE
jgi:hypothetical protein